MCKQHFAVVTGEGGASLNDFMYSLVQGFPT